MIFRLNAVPEDCSQVIEMIMTLRKQLQYSLSDERHRWTGILRRSTFAKNIQGSNSIEGYKVDYSDAVAAVDGEEPVDAKDKEWANVIGYRQALTYALQLSGDKRLRVEESTITAMHFMMLAHDLQARPGIWRRGAIRVTREVDQTVVYEGPDPEVLTDLMAELVVSLSDKAEMPVMVRAALAHLNLVMIHPFADGNGRMGRAIQTLILAREKIVDPVFSSIEEWLGKHTDEYYEVLAQVGKGAWHPENDPLPFIKFCLRAHFQQAEDLLRQDTMLQNIWKAVTEETKKRKLMERTSWAIADASVGIKVRNSAYRKQTAISNESASKDFRTLVEEGLLIPKGERKGRYYEASPLVQKLAMDAFIPRHNRDPFALVAQQAAAKAQPELPGMNK